MGKNARPCPDCGVPLHEVNAQARTGYLLALDQCRQCGGVWFDRWELFPLAHHEVKRLDPLDADKLMSLQPAREAPGPCPQCSIPLRAFRDPVLPADARIGRCAVCEGMWLQRGELTRVKVSGRAPSVASEPLSDKQIGALARHFGEAAKWAVVGDLDAATQTVEEAPPGPSEIGAALASAAPWLILQVLLRLLLKR